MDLPTSRALMDEAEFRAAMRLSPWIGSKEFRRAAVLERPTFRIPVRSLQVTSLARTIDTTLMDCRSGLLDMATPASLTFAQEYLSLRRLVRASEFGFGAPATLCGEVFFPGDDDYRLCALVAAICSGSEFIVCDEGASFILYFSPKETVSLVNLEDVRTRRLAESFNRMTMSHVNRSTLRRHFRFLAD